MCEDPDVSSIIGAETLQPVAEGVGAAEAEEAAAEVPAAAEEAAADEAGAEEAGAAAELEAAGALE